VWVYSIFYNDKAHSVEKEHLAPQGTHHVPPQTRSQQELRTIDNLQLTSENIL
jgi:hypothetical protein